MRKPLVIGIAGGSASGKSSISKELYKLCIEKKSVMIIRQDDYYKDQTSLSMNERVRTNYDHPFAFDNDLLVEQLDLLIDGQTIQKPVYDFVNHTRSKHTEQVTTAEVIIIEGLFVLENEDVRKRLDIKIFVDTDADIRFIRRMLRDVNERGRTLDSIVNQYVNTVRSMHNRFVEPSKRYADVIVPEGSENTVAIDLIATKISSIMAESVI